MSREHSDRADDSVNISGSLKEALKQHAYERCRHFFLYVFHAKALTDYVNAKHGLGLGPTDILYVNATHQIDSGLRSTEVEYYGFDAKDVNIVDKSATSCGRTDAAHFCNLGIEARCQSKFGVLASGDQFVFTFFEALKKICGNTRQLPQRVNIGPDKIIDKFHGEFATLILSSGKPPITATTLKVYLESADEVMKEYEDKQTLAGNHGVAACVKAYRSCYSNDGDSLWMTLSGNAREECEIFKLKQDDYFNMQ